MGSSIDPFLLAEEKLWKQEHRIRKVGLRGIVWVDSGSDRV